LSFAANQIAHSDKEVNEEDGNDESILMQNEVNGFLVEKTKDKIQANNLSQSSPKRANAQLLQTIHSHGCESFAVGQNQEA
jgi:hypothetical protein